MNLIVFEHFQTLERSKEALLDRLAALDPGILECPPRPGAWSLVEIVQHLMLSEEEVLRQMKSPRAGRRTIRDFLGLAMVNFVFRRGIRVKTPMDSVVPSPRMSMDQLRERWTAVRSGLADQLHHTDDLNKLTFHHPIAGSMNVLQTLELIELHFKHHGRQIERTLLALAQGKMDSPP